MAAVTPSSAPTAAAGPARWTATAAADRGGSVRERERGRGVAEFVDDDEQRDEKQPDGREGDRNPERRRAVHGGLRTPS